jgi:hypothetical protein
MSTEEKRAPDQDAAIEAAFVAGTLPEEDRRREEATATAVATLVAENEELRARLAESYKQQHAPKKVDPSHAAITQAGVGSIFERTAIGWNVKYVDGGTVIVVQGPTIADALASHGGQVVHPKSREQIAREVALV